MRTVLILSLVYLSFVASFAQAHHHGLFIAGAHAAPLSGESLYNLNSEWTDQNGRKVKFAEFRGRPAVLVMLYTSCKAACPVLIEDVKKIEADLGSAGRSQVRFVVVSLDPVRDTQAALKKFSEAHHLDPASWTLLHGSEGQVRELANATGVKFQRTDSGNYSHSNILSTLDKDGVVRHQQVGLGVSNKDTITALRSYF